MLVLRLPRWIALLVVFILNFFDPDKWAIWEYRATVLNDGVNTGNHDYAFTAGRGNICVLLGGEVLNGDATARNILIILRTVGNNTLRSLMMSTSVAAGSKRSFPTSESSSDDGFASVPPDIVIAGDEKLFVRVSSLAINENTEIDVQMLISGTPPTVVITSPTGATETETENRVV